MRSTFTMLLVLIGLVAYSQTTIVFDHVRRLSLEQNADEWKDIKDTEYIDGYMTIDENYFLFEIVLTTGKSKGFLSKCEVQKDDAVMCDLLFEDGTKFLVNFEETQDFIVVTIYYFIKQKR
jgi:hypothetical protein